MVRGPADTERVVAKRTWSKGLWGPLVGWVALSLFGCGGVLQAEDAETVALVQRARILYDQHRYEDARLKAETALKRSPENPQAHYLRGLACLAAGDASTALDALQEARRIDPGLLFAKTKLEFEQALSRARAQAGKSGTDAPPPPPTGEVPPELVTPAKEKPANGRPAPSDPLALELTVGGAQVLDRSPTRVLDAAQTAALERAGESLANCGIILKAVTLGRGVDAEAAARRLHDQAGLDDRTLVVVGTADGNVGAYAPTADPATTAKATKQATELTDASVARRMVVLAGTLGAQLRAPEEAPEQPAPGPLPEVVAPPTATTPTPAPRPAEPDTRLRDIGYGAGGLAGALLLWWLVQRVRARRRLATGFAAADPRLAAVADRLTAVCRRLYDHPVRRAVLAFDGAELAFTEAVAMMAAASATDTGHIARVERAARLLAEADEKLARAEEALADEPPGAGAAAAPAHCYFSARPLFDPEAADRVVLVRGNEERQVLVAPAVGERIRRGERPEVCVVEVDGRLVHWATAPDFEPAYDLFHQDRHGCKTAPIEALAEPFFADPEGRAFRGFAGRPDYRIDIGS